MLGYVPIGLTFGLLAEQQQIGIVSTVLLSALVYAGASQFVALTFIGLAQYSLPQIFITIWLVNLRHFILSLVYLPLTVKWNFGDKLKLFTLLTDETFAVLLNTKEIKKDPKASFRVAVLNYLTWNISTFLGFYLGVFIPNPKTIGLDFALTALFIALVTLFIKKTSHWITFVSTIMLTFFFYQYLDLGRNSVILAALFGSTLGWLWERQRVS